jgi:hypothetical protein
MSLSDLLEAEDRLVAHIEPLTFQEGRPLVTVAEESTELVDASFDELASRQVLMVEEGKDDGDFPIVEFDVVSEDEVTANIGDENDANHEARRAGIELARSGGGGSTSVGDLCIASLTLNSPL